MEKAIERYIQFALDNGFDMYKFVSELEKFSNWTKNFRIGNTDRYISIVSNDDNSIITTLNVKELITSNEFIDSIARGIYDDEEPEFRIEVTIDMLLQETIQAIYNNSLEEFINNLIPNK